MDTNTQIIPEEYLEMVMAFLEENVFLISILSVVGLIALAIYSYRLWHVEMKFISALGFGYLGYFLGVTLIKEPILMAGEIDINLPAVIGCVAALIGAVLAKPLEKLVVFAAGGIGGFSLGAVVFPLIASVAPEAEFFTQPYAFYIISGVLALLGAILALLLFKHVYIIFTSIGFMFLAGGTIAATISSSEVVSTVLPIVFAILGIFCAKAQYKADKLANG